MKTGYRVAQDLDRSRLLGRKGRGEGSRRGNEKRFWKSVWKLDATNKIRHFLWRCCKNVVAVKHNLTRRGS